MDLTSFVFVFLSQTLKINSTVGKRMGPFLVLSTVFTRSRIFRYQITKCSLICMWNKYHTFLIASLIINGVVFCTTDSEIKIKYFFTLQRDFFQFIRISKQWSSSSLFPISKSKFLVKIHRLKFIPCRH